MLVKTEVSTMNLSGYSDSEITSALFANLVEVHKKTMSTEEALEEVQKGLNTAHEYFKEGKI